MVRLIIILFLILFFMSIYSESFAEESSYASYSPAVYAIAGLLVLDIGVSISNSFSLINGRPNKINGYFGAVTGVISLGLAAASLVMEDDEDLRNEFLLVMGTAGVASLTLGVMNIRRAKRTEDEPIGKSEIKIYPGLTWDSDHKHRVSINLQTQF
jgi:peptidoglycan/LPS O-acetylase OafA/YrhL